MLLTFRSLCLSALGLSGGVFFFLVQATATVQEGYQISIESAPTYFSFQHAVVKAEIPILWVNSTPTHHTVTHDGCMGGGACVFDSNPIPPNGRYEIPGLPPGEYSYHCRLHPIMRGKLIVAEQAESGVEGFRKEVN